MGDGIKLVGKGRWLVRVKRVAARTGRVENRKRIVHGKRTDAARVRDQLRAELASSATRRPPTRLEDFASAWLLRRKESGALKPSVVRKYFYSLTHIRPVLGELLLDAITPADVERYIGARIRDAAANTVLNELRLLRVLARDAVAESYSTRFWCERVRPPRVARYSLERPNLLSPDQAELVIANVPRRWLGLVLFLVTTGARIGEALALRWGDVDLEAGTAFIRATNYRGELGTTKTVGSTRVVPVLRDVVALWGLPRGPDELVFATRSGKPHRGSPLRRVLDAACAAAGAPRITTHGLRRTFNNLGRGLAAREVLKSLTGHTTDAMVEAYSVIGTGEKAELTRRVADLVGVPKVSADRTPNVDK